MGCCQGRDSRNETKALTRTTASLSISNFESEELMFHVETSYKIKDYEELVRLCFEKSACFTELTVLWAEAPGTVGCLSVMYLIQAGLEDGEECCKFMRPLLPFLLKSIKTGTNDLRENSLILLSVYVDQINPSKVQELLELNVFSILVRFFMCSKVEVRIMSANICQNIYKNQPKAQESFLRANGGIILLQLVTWTVDREEDFWTTLKCLENLVLDENRCVRANIRYCLVSCMGTTVLKEIPKKHLTEKNVEYLDHMINIISP